MVNKNSFLEQYLIFNLIRTIHLMILKHPLNGSLKGVCTLLSPNSQQEKHVETKTWAVEKHYITSTSCPCPANANFLQFCAQPKREFSKLPIWGYVQAKAASQWPWRKGTSATALEWEKIEGTLAEYLHEMYIADVQKNNDPKDTDRLHRRYGKYKSFWVTGTASTFSSTLCVDLCHQLWNEAGELVDITREHLQVALVNNR